MTGAAADPPPGGVAQGLTTGLRVATMRLARRLRQQGQREEFGGLTPSQLSTLASVDRLGPLTLGALADAEKVQPPSMTRVVAVLEAQGLLRREISPTDARAWHVSATPLGHTRIAEIRSRRDEWLEVRLRALPADDLAALERAVAVIQGLAES